MPSSRKPSPSAVPLRKAGHTTYHLAPRDYWESRASCHIYVPERFDDEGFIHCTDTIDEVIAAGNRYYRDDSRPYLLLEIDCESVGAPIVYEDQARLFPHIYGPLEIAAILRTCAVTRDASGRFLAIDAP